MQMPTTKALAKVIVAMGADSEEDQQERQNDDGVAQVFALVKADAVGEVHADEHHH